MSNDTQLTITGNLVDDPELPYTPNGQPAVRFRIASTPRFYDKAGESAGCPARARSLIWGSLGGRLPVHTG